MNNKIMIPQLLVSLAYRGMIVWCSCIVILSSPLWLPPYLLVTGLIQVWYALQKCFCMVRPLILASPAPALPYAVLKGNGRYMRTPHEHVFIHQLYDYAARRFLVLSTLEANSNLLEIECENPVGINYLKEKNESLNVIGLQSNPTIYRLMDKTNVRFSDYSCPTPTYNCILAFNLKTKRRNNGSSIDLIQAAEFCKESLKENGYVVFGEYVKEGEDEVIKSVFNAYSLRFVGQEDVEKNICHGEYLLQLNKNCFENILDNHIFKRIKRMLGLNHPKKGNFTLFIFESN